MTFREKRAAVSTRREVRITNKLGLHARPAAQFGILFWLALAIWGVG